MFTYDYFAVLRTVREKVGNDYQFKNNLSDWTNIKSPLALVVMGQTGKRTNDE